jgi:hypothetical protein
MSSTCLSSDVPAAMHRKRLFNCFIDWGGTLLLVQSLQQSVTSLTTLLVIRLNSAEGNMINEWNIGKYVEGNCHGLTEVRYQHLPGGAEKNFRIFAVPDEIRTEHNSNQKRHCLRQLAHYSSNPQWNDCCWRNCLIAGDCSPSEQRLRRPSERVAVWGETDGRTEGRWATSESNCL